MDWGGANSRFLGLVSVWAARSFDQTALRLSVMDGTHPSRTSVKSDQGFFGVESVMRVNADSLLIRAAATSTSGTLNDLTTDLIMANNNNNCLSSKESVKLTLNT